MKTTEDIAKQITKDIASSAFKLFRNKKFRKYSILDSFDQTEQDRIFNEIIISAFALADLFLETILEDPKNNQDFFGELKVELLSAYRNLLIEIGSKKEDSDLFKTVIQMRAKEYREDYQKNKKDLPAEKAIAWPFVVAIGGYDHIKRGKGSPEDPLFPMFLDWIKSIFKIIIRIR